MRKVIVALGLAGILAPCAITSAADEETEKAPENFQVKFETTAGDFTVDVTRSWAPNGADRFYNAVQAKFYDDCRFFRVVPNFMAQFGINGDPEVQKKWVNATIPDDPVKKSNTRGMVTFAKTNRPNSRTTQLFINFKDNSFLDDQGFAPFGKVSAEGMKVVDKINDEYRQQPSQAAIQKRGNKYLKENFPRLDSIKKARVVEKKE